MTDEPLRMGGDVVSRAFANYRTICRQAGVKQLRNFSWAIILLIASFLPLHSYAQQRSVYTPSWSTEDKLVAFFETDSYTSVYVWCWNDMTNLTGGSWPGEPAQRMGVAANGKTIWKWTYRGAENVTTNMPTGIIFSDSGYPQTDDLPFHNGGYYTEYGYEQTIQPSTGGGQQEPVIATEPLTMRANAADMYDFDGDGLKEVVNDAFLYDDMVHGFAPIATPNQWEINNAISPLHFDLNNDGRKDYIELTQSVGLSNGTYAQYGDIHYQQADGSYRREPMQVMVWSEYEAQMTEEERNQMNDPSNYSLGNVGYYASSLNWTGGSLARAPQRQGGAASGLPLPRSQAPRKSVGLGYTTAAPTKAVDLNNDGIMDFIFPGATLYTMMWNNATHQFVVYTLYRNAAVDDLVWCYDFDHDGDLDLLATFSAANNSTGFAYTCFFINDGNGNFTQQDEQDYGANKLWFSNLQDLDGDGYYDLLAFRGEVYNSTGFFATGWTCTSIPDIVWLKGQSNLTFAQPQILFTPYEGTGDFNMTIGQIEAEDLNNDGRIDIWLSGIGDVSGFVMRDRDTICHLPSAVVNAAPTAPAAPTLSYNNGYLTVTWGNGADDHTQTVDLTYDLRIGTSSGAMDILRPHANADGSRRNFLDGAMGRKHSYTIDLNTYMSGTIYVAVQAGDATITNLSESQVSITWATAGTKTITHTVTSPTGASASATATVKIFPIAMGYPIDAEDMTIPYPMADYNYDGRLDGVVVGNYRSALYYSMMVYTGTNDGFTQAAGLWNTNILTSGAGVTPQDDWSEMPDMQWRDWNKDGHIDLVFRERMGRVFTYAYLPHTAGTTLSRRVEDDNIAELFNYTYEQGHQEYYG